MIPDKVTLVLRATVCPWAGHIVSVRSPGARLSVALIVDDWGEIASAAYQHMAWRLGVTFLAAGSSVMGYWPITFLPRPGGRYACRIAPPPGPLPAA